MASPYTDQVVFLPRRYSSLSMAGRSSCTSEYVWLLKLCNDQIDRVEKRVLKLTEEGQLEGFEYGEQ